MNKKKINWVFLAIVTVIALIFIAQSLLPPLKHGARRLQSVNSIAKITMPITAPRNGATAFVSQSRRLGAPRLRSGVGNREQNFEKSVK